MEVIVWGTTDRSAGGLVEVSGCDLGGDESVDDWIQRADLSASFEFSNSPFSRITLVVRHTAVVTRNRPIVVGILLVGR